MKSKPTNRPTPIAGWVQCHHRLLFAAIISAAVPLSGCAQIGAFIAVFSGGEKIERAFKLDEGRVAIFVDDPDQLGIMPEAMRTMHDVVVRNFEKHELKTQVTNWSEIERLRSTEPDFDDLSIRNIGEKLGVQQVVYVRVRYWATRDQPGDPHYKGQWNAGIKVIATQRERNVKLWPTDEAEYKISVATDPDLSDDRGTESKVAKELGQKMGTQVSRLFFTYKESEEDEEN